jgi:outer membrane protein
LLEVQRENLVAQRELLRQVEAFTTAGTHPISDLYQQQAATAAAQLAVTNATQATELAQVDLIQELVLDPRGSYEFSCPPPDSAAPPVFRLDSLISVAVAQRADVHAQALRVEAAQREILVASGGRLPVVSATIGYGTSINSGLTNGIGQQIDQQRGGAIGLGVSIPILDRGAVSITRQRDQVALDVATLALRDQTQAAALDVRRALLSYQSAQEQIIAADAQVRAGTLGLQASEARYRAGATGVTFVEVTLARATLVQAQSASVTARSNLAFQRTLMSYYTGALDFANVRIGQ